MGFPWRRLRPKVPVKLSRDTSPHLSQTCRSGGGSDELSRAMSERECSRGLKRIRRFHRVSCFCPAQFSGLLVGRQHSRDKRGGRGEAEEEETGENPRKFRSDDRTKASCRVLPVIGRAQLFIYSGRTNVHSYRNGDNVNTVYCGEKKRESFTCAGKTNAFERQQFLYAGRISATRKLTVSSYRMHSLCRCIFADIPSIPAPRTRERMWDGIKCIHV